MAKFSARRARVRAPIQSVAKAVTYEGGVAYSRNAKSELFLLAVSNMVSEKTFYEGADERDARFRDLIATVTREDPDWIRRFVPFLRDEMNMRSAAVVMAAEYVHAGGKNGRSLVAAACQRADEPGEMLAYWRSQHGRNIPQPVKRGVADAVGKLYNERSMMKWDGSNRAWRFGDVIDVVHPKPDFAWKSDLYKYALDLRHAREDLAIPVSLEMLRTDERLRAVPQAERREYMRRNPEVLKAAGMTWEKLSAWLAGPMDAEAWESIIPSMGYMALLRNLRNFDEAGISKAAIQAVKAKLADPEEVARSRQFPIRFFSAWKAVASMHWGDALEEAFQLSIKNIPAIPGSSLILVDCSGSMEDRVSDRSEVLRCELAGVFGVGIAVRCEKAKIVRFGSNWQEIALKPRAAVLRAALELGVPDMGGTNTWQTLRATYSGQDRVFIVTDEQYHPNWGGYAGPDAPVYTWNVAGYRVGHEANDQKRRYTFGGLTDAAFRMVPLIEAGRDARWPWEK